VRGEEIGDHRAIAMLSKSDGEWLERPDDTR
jgi:hypothetical protein